MAELVMLIVLIIGGGVVSDVSKESERKRLDEKYKRS